MNEEKASAVDLHGDAGDEGGLVGGEIERGVSNVAGRGESEVKSITRLTLPQGLAATFLGFGEARPADSRHFETERAGNVRRRDGENPGIFHRPFVRQCFRHQTITTHAMNAPLSGR